MTVSKFVLLFVKLLQQPLIAAGLGGNSCFAFRVYTRFRCREPNEKEISHRWRERVESAMDVLTSCENSHRNGQRLAASPG